ncbi:type I-E CRISPR-associated protein Cse1/CasA [Saccharopolyspora sp. ID03-671]|uniref:type I-E CRISPR-associated protein Cse1/CasA n=1 Tax=Saccharopolyspora sp. ID03-671 TaxID=3073066 RepID=UPI00324764C4
MSTDLSFDLLDEPWILALGLDGRQHELSLVEMLERAPGLGMISGEVPTQAFAITRLLLAFLHRALDGPEDQDDWAQLWSETELPMDRVRAYGDRVRSRFDLFDPDTPFFQVAGLHTAKNEVAGLEKLIADVPNGEPFFTTRSAASFRSIPAGEAARWLVHAHAFDTSGIKSGAVGDPKVKDGKGYGSRPGWSGQIGGVLPQGANLRETLVLNLISRDASFVRLGGSKDLPPWEREADGPGWAEERPPAGAIELYTWQTRRVRLAGDRSGVSGVVLANGDKIVPQNRHGLEPHTAWRYSEPQSKKLKTTTYMPNEHRPERSVWRGLEAMLPSVSPRRGPAGDAQKFLAPGVLQWLGDLAHEGHLPSTYAPALRVLGVEYRAKETTFAEIVDDVLPVSVALLSQDHPALGRLARDAVDDARGVARAVWRLAENVAQASGAEPKSGAGDRAEEALFSLLETPYREWVVALGPDTDRTEARRAWQRTVRDAAFPVVDELVEAAPPVAWTGRMIQKRLVNVAISEAWYRAAVRKALPLAYSDRQVEEAG